MGIVKYIDKSIITTATSHPLEHVANIYSRHINAIKFLGITLEKERMEYSCDPNFNCGNRFDSIAKLLNSKGRYTNGFWNFFADKKAFIVDEKEKKIYKKPYIIVETNQSKSYIKFFENEKDMKSYIDNLGLPKKMFSLEYDVSC